MKNKIFILACAVSVFTACNSNNNENQTQANDVATSAKTTDAATSKASAEAVITLSAGDNMKFDVTEIKAKEGQTVKLTLKHIGKLAKTAMGHNFILLAHGVSLTDFALKALKAKDTDYIPVDSKKDIITHTKLIGGGESDTIEFTAPAKGTYEFLCSFPGHSAMMKGAFIVE